MRGSGRATPSAPWRASWPGTTAPSPSRTSSSTSSPTSPCSASPRASPSPPRARRRPRARRGAGRVPPHQPGAGLGDARRARGRPPAPRASCPARRGGPRPAARDARVRDLGSEGTLRTHPGRSPRGRAASGPLRGEPAAPRGRRRSLDGGLGTATGGAAARGIRAGDRRIPRREPPAPPRARPSASRARTASSPAPRTSASTSSPRRDGGPRAARRPRPLRGGQRGAPRLRPTLILEHPDDAEPFWTLFGHLEAASLGLSGDEIPAGAVGGRGGGERRVATAPHFQVILDRLELMGDFPGVAPPDRRAWCALPRPRAAPRRELRGGGHSTEELLAARRAGSCSSMSISYRRPLQMVKGRAPRSSTTRAARTSTR